MKAIRPLTSRLVRLSLRKARTRRRSSCLILLCLTLAGLTGCRAQQPWPLWEAYRKNFIDDSGRVIDHSAQDRTTSEGQAYAMFFALVDNDRPRFDKLLRWTEDNLADGDLTLHLPSWNWGKSAAGDWKTIDANSASDADLWMAYSLIEAGRLWQEPRYDKLGRVIAERIAREEVILVPGVGTTIASGPQGFHPDDADWIVNPSYLPLPVLTRLAKVEPQGPWSEVLASWPEVMDGAATHGFAMDWELVGPSGVRPSVPPAEPASGKRLPQASGSYDAIRVYLWLGVTDPRTPGAVAAMRSLSGMAGYMKTAMIPPLEVDAQGNPLRTDSPVGFSAAVAPYLMAAGMPAQAKAQMDRVAAMIDPATGLYGRGSTYYDQNLVLFSTAFVEHRYKFDRDGSLKVAWK